MLRDASHLPAPNIPIHYPKAAKPAGPLRRPPLPAAKPAQPPPQFALHPNVEETPFFQHFSPNNRIPQMPTTEKRHTISRFISVNMLPGLQSERRQPRRQDSVRPPRLITASLEIRTIQIRPKIWRELSKCHHNTRFYTRKQSPKRPPVCILGTKVQSQMGSNPWFRDAVGSSTGGKSGAGVIVRGWLGRGLSFPNSAG